MNFQKASLTHTLQTGGLQGGPGSLWRKSRNKPQGTEAEEMLVNKHGSTQVDVKRIKLLLK